MPRESLVPKPGNQVGRNKPCRGGSKTEKEIGLRPRGQRGVGGDGGVRGDTGSWRRGRLAGKGWLEKRGRGERALRGKAARQRQGAEESLGEGRVRKRKKDARTKRNRAGKVG